MSESTPEAPQEPPTPFHDLEAFVRLPRPGGLALSNDGTRLVTTVAAPNPDATTYVTSLWEIDPAGERPAKRLTRGAKGESSPAFLPDGSLLFVSARPDPESTSSDDAPPALWLLPAGGGEARVVGTRPGGISGISVARESGTVVVGSPTLPSSTTAEDEESRRKTRKDRKVSAILHESYPVRYWDSDLGPDRQRLLAADPLRSGALPDDARLELRDLTGHVDRAIGPEAAWDVTPDGRTAVISWTVPEEAGSERYTLVAVDTSDGSRRVLMDDPETEYADPTVSPDGTRVAVIAHSMPTDSEPPDRWLVVVDLATGESQDVARGWDRWPAGPPAWTADGSALLVPVDEAGGSPIYRVDVGTGEPTRLTTDRSTYSSIQVAPDGRAAYAVRGSVDVQQTPVRFDPATPGEPVALLGPAPSPKLPGRLDEVTTTAQDGTPLRAWLAVPEGASAERPAPLLLWIHGGPIASWNTWSWRWNPWLMVAAGYAVLLPDPALSTGYGRDFVRRGWGRWGSEPFTDLMGITDAALERDDLDADRTAAMGGSFGGYMANWVAGHTDRFLGIVSHAGIWALDQFGPTTDAYYYWRREMTQEMEAANSPHQFVDRIRTPMLVIHGDKDYRVPIGEALRLWAELSERSTSKDGVSEHKLLVFPDENHWILSPQHAVVWYSTVLAFLATTVHGQPWQVPELLR